LLITTEEIKNYLLKVPPLPESVRKSLLYLKEGELKKAAMEADKDLILKKQIYSFVNSAYFSLSKRVDDTIQLFSLIGVERVKALIYSYLVTLLIPEKWGIFNIDFKSFQATFMMEFEKFMKFEFNEKIYKKYAEIGAIVPVAVCVCDMLFASKKEKVDIVLNATSMEYGILLKRLTGISLFELAAEIAKIWEMEDEKIKILKKSECNECKDEISALIHFLFFYITSKPQFLDINSLIEFKPECLNLIPKTYERIINDS